MYEVYIDKLLDHDFRKVFNLSLYVAKNFLDTCILDTIALIFVAYRVIDVLRVFQEFNTIVEGIKQSGAVLTIFLATYLGFNIAVVPLAQGIWGTLFIGYIGFVDCLNSCAMIAYSKGDLEFLLETNPLYSIMFLFIYYMVLIYVMHSGFHMT